MTARIDIHERGHGCLSDVNTAISGLTWCCNQNIPVSIDWRNSLYNEDQSVNMWDVYFRQPAVVVEPDIVYDKITPIGYGWSEFRTKRDVGSVREMLAEPVYWLKTLRILDTEVFHEFQEEAHRLFGNDRVLGVHRRATDRNDNGPLMTKEAIFSFIDRLDFERIFLITDCEENLTVFKERYRDRLFTTDSSRSSNPTLAVHRGGVNDVNRDKLARDVLRDAYVLSQTSFRLLTGSNVSLFSLLCDMENDFLFMDEGVAYPI